MIAAMRSGSGRTQEAEMMCPANFTVPPILSFRLLIVIFIRGEATDNLVGLLTPHIRTGAATFKSTKEVVATRREEESGEERRLLV